MEKLQPTLSYLIDFVKRGGTWEKVEDKEVGTPYPLFLKGKDRAYLIGTDKHPLLPLLSLQTRMALKEKIPVEHFIYSQKEFEELQRELESLEEVPHEEEEIDESEVGKRLEEILSEAVNKKVSDVFIYPALPKDAKDPEDYSYFLKLNKGKENVEVKPLSRAWGKRLVNKVVNLASRSIAEQSFQSGKFITKLPQGTYQVRVEVSPSVYGRGIFARILETISLDKLSLEKLHFPEELLEKYKQYLFSSRGGLILNSGETGAGKTTTLVASIVEILKEKGDKVEVRTVEDPVEYHIPNALQVEVNPELGITFAKAIRSFLRQTPNVILVGEIRDRETAKVAVDAALSGHTVLSTVHAEDTVKVLFRLKDLGAPLESLSSALKVILNQVLLKRLCPRCRRKVELPAEARAATGLSYGFEAVGCEECGHTGYIGFIPAFEALFLAEHPQLRKMFTEGAGEVEIKNYLKEIGFKNLYRTVKELAERGEVDWETLMRFPKDPILNSERESGALSAIELGSVIYPKYKIPVKLKYKGAVKRGFLHDISNHGVSILLEGRELVPVDFRMEVEVYCKGGVKKGWFTPKRLEEHLAYGSLIAGGVWHGEELFGCWGESSEKLPDLGDVEIEDIFTN